MKTTDSTFDQDRKRPLFWNFVPTNPNWSKGRTLHPLAVFIEAVRGPLPDQTFSDISHVDVGPVNVGCH